MERDIGQYWLLGDPHKHTDIKGRKEENITLRHNNVKVV